VIEDLGRKGKLSESECPAIEELLPVEKVKGKQGSSFS